MIRNISLQRIKSLKNSSGFDPLNSDLFEISHMIVDRSVSLKETKLDLKKARNWIESAGAERITKEPSRQGIDEINQFHKLKNSFYSFSKLRKGIKFLVNGKVHNKGDNFSIPDPSDLDAEIKDHDNTILVSCKTCHIDGTAQYRQFKDLERLIPHAPLKTDINAPFLLIYISGNYWTKNRKIFKHYKNKYDFNNLKELLQQLSLDKKVYVISDEDLPSEKCNFLEYMKQK